MSERIKKINELLRHETAEALKKADISGFVTVKAVETTPDLKHATIWVGILNDEEKILAELDEKRRDIQHMINKRISTKNVPVISFKADHSGDHAQKIEELLRNDREKSN